MRSRIFVRGLAVECRIGVSGEERVTPRPLRVDVELEVDVEAAAEADDLRLTVDYRKVRDVVRGVAGSREFRLVESFAREVALALSGLDGVTSVRVRVEKPGVPRGAEGAGVEVEL
ncbi:MAG: dihydroneopterin aldolase [Conexivisphaera sp.]